MLIDTHCHLTSPELLSRLDAVLASARAAGVERMILVAVNQADAQAALNIIGQHEGTFLVGGIHPHEAGKCGQDDISALRALRQPPVPLWACS